MSKHLNHDITIRSDGLWWCDTEDTPSDFCEDEDRCSNGCVCNVGDPDVRDRHVALYEGVYGDELASGEVTESQMLAMALVSAKHELDEGEEEL